MSILDQVKNYLSEAVYGKVVTFYHRTNESAIEPITKGGFSIGRGDFYGPGVYGCFELSEQFKHGMQIYGDYIVKSKTNVDRFIILDEGVARKVYGDKWLPKDQFKLFCDPGVYNNTSTKPFLKFLKNYIPRESTASFAKNMWEGFLSKNRTVWKQINGLIYAGGQSDGDVIIVYDTKNIIPMGWANASTNSNVDVNTIQFAKTFDLATVQTATTKEDLFGRQVDLDKHFSREDSDKIDKDAYIMKALRQGFKINMEDITKHVSSDDVFDKIKNTPEMWRNVIIPILNISKYLAQHPDQDPDEYILKKLQQGFKINFYEIKDYASNATIKKIVDNRYKNVRGVSSAYVAVALLDGDLDLARYFIYLETPPNSNSLSVAITANVYDRDIIEWAVTNVKPEYDYYILRKLVSNGNVETVKFVLSQTVPNFTDKEWMYILNEVIQTKNPDMVKLIISMGVKPTGYAVGLVKDPFYGYSPELISYVEKMSELDESLYVEVGKYL